MKDGGSELVISWRIESTPLCSSHDHHISGKLLSHSSPINNKGIDNPYSKWPTMKKMHNPPLSKKRKASQGFNSNP